MNSLTRRLLLAGAVVMGVAGAPVLAAAQRSPVEEEHPEVKELVLDGVVSVDKSELKRNIATSESGCNNMLAQIFFCWFSKAPAFYEREYLDRDDLRADLLRIRVFYYLRGWRDTQVDTSVVADGDGVKVTFHVQEGEPTRVGRVQVLYDSTVLTQRRVERLVSVRAGEPLSLLALDSSRVLLQGDMWEKGFADAKVDTIIAVDSVRRRADVTFQVVNNRRATVGTITILGAEQVDPTTIVNAMPLRTGEIFRRSDVIESQRNLYESNLFRTVIVTVPEQADTVKDVEVNVLEAPEREARVAGGFNTIDYVQLEGRLTHYNLFGGARRLDVSGAVSNLFASAINGAGPFRTIRDENRAYLLPTYQVSAEFRQPSFLQRPENAVGFGAFLNRRAATGVYIEHGWGGTATFTRNIAEGERASANYRFEVTRVEASDVYFCVNYGVCDTTTINVLKTRQTLSPATVTYIRDKSNELFTPTTGYVLRGSAEHASALTASHYQYNRATADAAYYFRIGRSRAKGWASSSVSPAVTNTVLAVHLRAGLVRPVGTADDRSVLHPRKRFYAGGSQSVRGYAENQLGPRILTVAPERLQYAQSLPGGVCDATSINVRYCDPNSPDTTGSGQLIRDENFIPRPLGGTSIIEGGVELRFPIYKKITGAAFIDAGAVGEASAASFVDLVDFGRLRGATWAVTPGVGVRYHTRVGPIRVDLGYNPHGQEALPVVTEVLNAEGEREIVPLDRARLFQPHRRWYQRLTLHLSIGQAY
jgi:outer membrane protein assembly factor BamA